MAAPIEEVCLIDAEDNKEYKIILSSGDAEKARRNMNFATLLLAKAKEQYMLPQATSELLLQGVRESFSHQLSVLRIW
ncbi:uncharacterized protein LOC112589229 isoform X4 [Harpegnathos saltator]|uniref:uncharacterized protein LOC112589229 isoform X4 n=1 Tax=Harpegnathos saltator TaxID=610380 RepID=UPI000DBEEF03|nr:uncharacterized protein LOC112589229 isoform X4 [Harpegnathos saltator]